MFWCSVLQNLPDQVCRWHINISSVCAEVAGVLMTCLDRGGRHSQVACSLIEMLFAAESPTIQMQTSQQQLLDMQVLPTLAILLRNWCTAEEQSTQETGQ